MSKPWRLTYDDDDPGEILSDSSVKSSDQMIPLCSQTPSNLQGKLNISLEVRKMEEIVKDLGNFYNSQFLKGFLKIVLDFIQIGGRFTPRNCTPLHHVAIIIAYRFEINEKQARL